MAKKTPGRSKGYSVFPHTADVGLALSGRTLPDLYRNALQGLLVVFGLPPTERLPRGGSRGAAIPRNRSAKITLEADSPETLLVDWLNELIYRIGTEGRVPEGLRVLAAEPDRLEAELLERPLAPRESLRTEIKSATYHALKVRRRAGRWTARVILDV